MLVSPGLALYVGPSEDLIVYPVIAFPPVAGAVQETISWLTFGEEGVGAAITAGTEVTVIEDDGADEGDGPAAFEATTVKVYAVFD